MAKIINGFQEILSRYNLATNGGFLINQRNLYTTTTPVLVNDYVSDAWKVYSNTIDYITCLNNTTFGTLEFNGYGKKDQHIILNNNDKASNLPSANNDPSGKISLTASYDFNITKGKATTSIVSRYKSGASFLFQKIPYCVPSLGKGYNNNTYNPVEVVQTSVNFDSYPKITIALKSDGEFSFTVTNFRELVGAFRNPPAYAPVHLSEDLARCKKYYQKGTIYDILPLYKTTSLIANKTIDFPIEMNSTPTVTSILNSATTYQNPENGNDSTASDEVNWTPINNNISNKGFQIQLSRAAVSMRSTILTNLSWTASC